MKYEIEFTEQTADQTYMGLWELFHLSDVGTYNDNGFDRIGFARINSHEFVKNGEFKHDVLRKALDELV